MLFEIQGRTKRLKFFYKQEAGDSGEGASVLFPQRPHVVLGFTQNAFYIPW